MANVRWPVRLALIASLAYCPLAAHAQSISFPKANQQVRGTIQVTFEDIPEGGYAMIYLDGTGMDNLKEATSEPFYVINTFTLSEGQHSLSVIFFNAGGKRSGTADVTFEVANSSIDTSAQGIKLRVWNVSDLTNDIVRRYRIFAESNVSIEGGSGGGAGGAGGGLGSGGGGGGSGGGGGLGGGAGGGGGDQWIPAPLDYQMDLLIRSVVRDVGLIDGAANIRSIVQEAYQRQRLSEEGKGGAGGAGGTGGGGTTKPRRKKGQKPAAPSKAPWGTWFHSADTGRYFVKTIRSNGEEINATRKIATLAVGDLLPRFPQGTVRPGSTWESDMALVGEIPSGTGVNVRAPMTFVSFEKIQTPAGVEKRCAKLEARFNLPLDVATRIGHAIQAKAGTKGGGAGGGAAGDAGAGGAGGAGGADTEPADFKTITTSVTREIWFDIAGNQVLRSTDSVATYYEEEPPENDTGGGAGGAGAGGIGGAGTGGTDTTGADTTPAEGPKVSYDLRITKYLDDVVPPPTDVYNGGANTAHARDNVRDPNLNKALGKR